MRVIKTATSLGCLGMKWNNLCKVSETSSLDNCCPLERTVLIRVRFTVSTSGYPHRHLATASTPLLLTPPYWWPALISVSSALPRPTTFLGDFKSTWILSFSFFTSAFSNNLHSVCYWNQLPLACEMCSFLPNSTSSDIRTIILKSALKGIFTSWQLLNAKKKKKQKQGSFLAHTTSFQPPDAMPVAGLFPSLRTFQCLNS